MARRRCPAKRIAHAGPAVARIGPDGRVSAFQRGSDLPWFPWSLVATELAATHLRDGTPVLFALGADGVLYHRWQDQPFAPWHEREPLGEGIRSFAVSRFPVGGLSVFAVGTDDFVRHRYQSKAFGEWSGWAGMRSRAQHVAAQPGYADGLEVFAIGMDDEVRHAWCDRLGDAWSNWWVLDYESSSLRLDSV